MCPQVACLRRSIFTLVAFVWLNSAVSFHVSSQITWAWHKSAVAEIVKVGSALARQTGDEESTTVQRLFQQLSLSLMRGNAALLNNCNPQGGHDDVAWWITDSTCTCDLWCKYLQTFALYYNLTQWGWMELDSSYRLKVDVMTPLLDRVVRCLGCGWWCCLIQTSKCCCGNTLPMVFGFWSNLKQLHISCHIIWEIGVEFSDPSWRRQRR